MKEITLLSITVEELKEIIKIAIREEFKNLPSEDQEPERFLNVDEASIYIKAAKSSLYKMTMEKTIPFYKPTGKRILFKKTELDNWISSHRSKTLNEIEEEATDYILRNER